MLESFYTNIAEIFLNAGNVYAIFIIIFSPLLLIIIDISALVVMIKRKKIFKSITSIILIPPITLVISPSMIGEEFFLVWTIVFALVCFLIVPTWYEVKRKDMPLFMMIIPFVTAFEILHFMIVLIWASWI